jgi:four helix bundle protein
MRLAALGRDQSLGHGLGARHAVRQAMSVRTYRGLIAWQLAHELRGAIDELPSDPRLARAFDLRHQLDRASDSACSNIAEGFGRRSHREFARFLDIALGSLGEIEDRLLGAVAKRRLDEAAIARHLNLVKRASVAAGRLRTYLLNTPTPAPRRPRQPPRARRRT